MYNRVLITEWRFINTSGAVHKVCHALLFPIIIAHFACKSIFFISNETTGHMFQSTQLVTLLVPQLVQRLEQLCYIPLSSSSLSYTGKNIFVAKRFYSMWLKFPM